jgi:hypothetical protein
MIFIHNFKFERMKKLSNAFFFAAFLMLPIKAQEPNPGMNPNPNLEKLNAYKIAFFTRRLNLTSQEAEKFWPVYNEFQDKRNSILLERQKLNRNINQNELNMSDKEMIEAGDKHVALQVQEAALAQEFHKKFREILSPQKILRLYQAENQYKLLLLNEIKDKPVIKNNLQKRAQGKNPI